ncbi:unnamed protein product, partial [Didymodactylos carnosus]
IPYFSIWAVAWERRTQSIWAVVWGRRIDPNTTVPSIFNPNAATYIWSSGTPDIE